MAIYWTIGSTPGYTGWSNPSWSSFMNNYGAHPFDSSATDPSVVDSLFTAGSTIVVAPYDGTYELRGAADNFGAIDLGGNNRTINGFTHDGKSVFKYYSAGQQIGIAWNFGNTPNGGTFSGNPCAAAIILIGPDTPPPPAASIYASPNPIYKGQSSTIYYDSSGANSTNYGSLSGSFTVSPDTATTYSVTATNAGGSTTASTVLNVLINKPTVTLTGTETSVIQGESLDLTWSATVEQDDLESASLTDVSLTATNRFGGTTTVTPNSTNSNQWTKRYTYSATNPSGTSDANWDVTVYIPPVLTLSVDDTTRILGQSTNLRWTYTGDASSIQWTKPEVDPPTNNNLSGSPESVSPTVTTTYCAVVTGNGGTSPEECVTVTVYQPPYIEDFYTPSSIQYNTSSFNITYETYYANTELKLEIFETGYESGPNIGSTLLYDTITLTPAASAEAGDTENGEATRDIDNPLVVDISSIWNQHGPRTIMVRLSGEGDGGNFVQENNIAVTIDETPDNITIPESEDLLKDADPVISPDTEILTDQIFIDGIDIPVEVLADWPVKVNKNVNGIWTNVRAIGSGLPVSGSSAGGSSFPTEPGVYHIKPNINIPDPPLIAKTQALTEEDYAKLVTCVSVIDETDSSSYNNLGFLNNVWEQSPAIVGEGYSSRGFRTAFPYRTFYILDPQGSGQSGIDVPTNYPSDPNAFGPIRVNRDGGNASNRSDWFDICNFDILPYGTIVSIWIDISGSMTLATVQASYDYFLTRCANAGIEIVLSLSAAGERYIEEHIQYLPPSANFTALYIDSDNNEITENITIIAGETVTLSWVVFGDVNNMNVNQGVQNTTSNFSNYVKSVDVTPSEETTYLLTVNGPAGTTTRSITIDVLVPPTLNLTADDYDLIAGQCTYLRWDFDGDASSISWTKGAVDNGNLNSSEQVCLDDTTQFCAILDGPAGPSPETCVTINVSQPPTAEITVPAQTDYGVNFNIDYTTQYANDSIVITVTYFYLNGTTTSSTINRTAASSAELGDPNSETIASGEGVPINVTWNDFGPYQITFSMSATGTGGVATAVGTTNVNIDETPDAFVIEESDDLLKDADPVYTPDTEILSEMYLINDIDIPVEIKSDWPIKVDKNANDNWENVRPI